MRRVLGVALCVLVELLRDPIDKLIEYICYKLLEPLKHQAAGLSDLCKFAFTFLSLISGSGQGGLGLFRLTALPISATLCSFVPEDLKGFAGT